MSPKRGDRAAPPPGPEEWEIRFHTNDAAKGWEELCRQAPGNTRAAWTTMRTNPAPRVASPRHQRLHGSLATGIAKGSMAKGQVLDHWQIEVTGGGRIWYLVDADRKILWIDYAGPGHPRQTD
ncbi:MAG: hypothetical protein J2P25_07205 [Nocardiopsaceae bacterium]|nr:hypothetical protein [Nocardiopsaceae bacterium]